MNFFPSRHRHCNQCCQRVLKIKDQDVIEYYHRAVVCHLIGFDLSVPLDAEPIGPGEGEVVAAERLLQRVFDRYCRFFDVVVADGLYLQSPFLNFCLQRGKHVIAVLKANNSSLLEDAKGLFARHFLIFVSNAANT